MEAFKLEILAAERVLYNGECISIVIPTTQGQYGIWANHANLIAAIIPGLVRFTLPDGKEVIAAVSAGLLKVEKNHVLLLVDTAEHPEEIDENRARRSAEAAREAMLQKRSIREYRSALATLTRALSRLKVKRDFPGQKN